MDYNKVNTTGFKSFVIHNFKGTILVYLDVPLFSPSIYNVIQFKCCNFCSTHFFLCKSLSDTMFYCFFRGHGNESCNLIGSLPGQYFPISAHGPRERCRESPSTSQLSLSFFTNIPRFPAGQYF